MVKKIIILALFLVIPFFVNSSIVTYAANSDSTTQQTQEKKLSFGEIIWQTIANLFVRLRLEVRLWFSNESPISCEIKTKFTDYDALNQDANSRAQTQSTQKYRKGTYLRSIIEGRYNDDTIAYFCGNKCTNNPPDKSCTPIKYSTLVYFFYKNGEKILYDKDDHKNPIDYDSAKMDSYNYTFPENSDTYFHNLYTNLTQIPRGAFQEEPNAAGVSSRELNESLRTFIPQSQQTATPTASVFNPDGAKAMILDNDLQQRTVYTNFIPDKYIPENLKITKDKKDTQVLGIDSNQTSTLRQLFRDNLHPKIWNLDEDGLPERENNGDCNAESSHCRGMSQYGALGMALAGKSYEEILKTYFGNVKLVSLKEFTKNMYVQVEISDDTCDYEINGKKIEVKSVRKHIEDYLRGLGELPSYWGDLGDLLPDPKNEYRNDHEGMNALKAQAIAARTEAFVHTAGFTKSICNTARCQVFRCTIIGKKPNFDIAVKETAYMVLVDATTGMPFNSQYARTFCGPSKLYNSWFRGKEYRSISYDGRAYETDGLTATKKDPNQWCIVK